MHAFRVGERLFQIIELKKSRNIKKKSQLVGLRYDKDLRIFDTGQYLEYKDFMAAYKQRNKIK
jgi:hypothetical protein